MADFGSSEAGKKGGDARAQSLSKDQRVAIARRAAMARHGKQLPRATHVGNLELGAGTVDCAVLEDGTRVFSQRGVAKAFGAGVPSGSRREDNLPAFLSSKNLKPFITNELLSKTAHIEYITPEGSIGHGVRAEAIPMICEVWLKARDTQNVLHKRQEHLARAADIIMRGLAHVGIVALVDEATGYQDDRARDELVKILRAFVAKELQPWISTFEMDFYRLICEVRGEPLSRAYKRPAYFGHLTNEIVYRRLAPGVLAELRRKNPTIEGRRRKNTHHQYLTRDVGHPKLKEHLAGVTTALRIVRAQHRDWPTFIELLDKTHPPHIEMPLFSQPDEEPET